MEMKTVFELKTLAKERGLHGYSRLTQRELVQLLQREEPMDIDSVHNHVDEENQRAIDTELFNRYL